MAEKASAPVALSGDLLMAAGTIAAGRSSAAPVVARGPVDITVTDVLDENEVNVQVPTGVAADVCSANANTSATAAHRAAGRLHGCDRTAPPGPAPAPMSQVGIDVASSGPAPEDVGGGPTPGGQERPTMTNELHLELQSPGPVIRLRVAGKLDAATVRPFLDAIEPLADGAQRAVIDCQDLTFCDSTGLRGLIIIRNRIGVRGSVTLVHPSDGLRRLLAITGLTEFLGEENSPS